MIGFCPLASGSKGNCIYVGTEETKLLIDAGLSAKATRERLAQIGITLDQIDAILITHEHSDHIKGVETISSTYNIPLVTNSDTAKVLHSSMTKSPKFKIFTTGEVFTFGDMRITAFNVQHDAIDPVAFVIECADKKLGFCADLGIATTHVAKHLMGCHHLYLEANHEPSMVHASARPAVYKERVLGKQGHLSNDECVQLLEQIAHKDLLSIHLAHLSSECNSEQLALHKVTTAIRALQLPTEVLIAYQDSISKPIPFTCFAT